MEMTPEDILKEYNQAKSKVKQIGILADLNNVKKQQIVEVLRNQGADLPYLYDKSKAPIRENPVPPDFETMATEVTRLTSENDRLKEAIIHLVMEYVK